MKSIKFSLGRLGIGLNFYDNELVVELSGLAIINGQYSGWKNPLTKNAISFDDLRGKTDDCISKQIEDSFDNEDTKSVVKALGIFRKDAILEAIRENI